MKKIIYNIGLGICFGAMLAGCSKFEEINTNPTAATADQVQVEYFINNSIIGSQMDPHIAERAFVLYWKTAGRHHLTTGLAGGGANDDWSSDYLRYASEWQNHINTAIQIADEKAANGSAKPYNNNLKQVARIWRAYLMSELADNFGPIPIQSFQGENPEFNNLKDVYYFLLDDLKDAVSKFDGETVPSEIQRFDQAYSFNFDKWKKYGNSLRLRFAMRIAEVDATKAKTEFENAASSGALITDAGDIFSVQEKDGWSPLSGVMSRPWNAQLLSKTINNLYLGLGGIPSANQLGTEFQASIKPANYIGKRFASHYPSKTNDPLVNFWMDGLPNTIDPRAYKLFIMPGDFSNANFWGNTDPASLNFKIPAVSGVNSEIPVNSKYTWNAYVIGNWGNILALNPMRGTTPGTPVLANNFRTSTTRRVFFANWETYFLLAEGALKGWTAGTTAKAAYESGVKASFAHWGLSSFEANYLASTSYNVAGTSVSWDHITEPPATVAKSYINGYTNVSGTYNMPYAVNTIYKNGTVKNDHLTKIITQKYLAQVPWLPLEAWNDHRRLGLPFFENIAVEGPNPNLPALTESNYMTNSIRFFPQRLPYPSSLKNSDPDGWQKAVELLSGADNAFTPLWWAKKQ
ncbi:MAG TPA: SusD/RagB family nutrient-binding outer membrane lipoprotein [Niabella sp.]|nr:SusD/RagB family nutrient-binding outer membrane lipoprotein [Niabella sp.]